MVLVIMLVPGAAGQAHGIMGWNADQFVDVPLTDLQISDGCADLPTASGGRIDFSLDNDTFWFHEGVDPVEEPGQQFADFLDWDRAWATCATAAVTMSPTLPVDHVHVRFDASRSVESGFLGTWAMPQELRIRDGQGGLIAATDVFPADAGSQSVTRFAELGADDAPFFRLPAGTDPVGIEWYFEDRGYGPQGRDGPVSTEELQATVTDPWIEFSSILMPLSAGAIRSSSERVGDTMEQTVRVDVTYTDAMHQEAFTNLRVIAAPEMRLSHVVAPDGTIFDDEGTLARTAEYTWDFDYLLEEPNAQQVVVTIPARLMRNHGTGDYTVVFASTSAIEPEPALVVANIAFALVPLALGIQASRRARAFDREAFGSYRRSARNFVVATVLLLVAYGIGILTTFFSGTLRSASSWPTSLLTLLFWSAIGAFILIFVFLGRAAKALYEVTRPQVRS